jgi:hypothetical protein
MSERDVVDTLAAARQQSGRRPVVEGGEELDLGAARGDKDRHRDVVSAAREVVVADDRLLELAWIEHTDLDEPSGRGAREVLRARCPFLVGVQAGAADRS